MNETEARDFIAREVSRLMWHRVIAFAAIFGVANVVAFVGLCFSVAAQAEAMAMTRATSVAERKTQDALEVALGPLKNRTDSAMEEVKGIHQSYLELLKNVVEQQVRMASLDGDYRKLKQDYDGLAKSVEAVKSEAVVKLAEAADAFRRLPEDQQKLFLQNVQIQTTRLESIESNISNIDEIGKAEAAKQDEIARKVEALTTAIVVETVDGVEAINLRRRRVICEGVEIRNGTGEKMVALGSEQNGRSVDADRVVSGAGLGSSGKIELFDSYKSSKTDPAQITPVVWIRSVGDEGRIYIFNRSNPKDPRLRLHAKVQGGNIYAYTQDKPHGTPCVQIGQRSLDKDNKLHGGTVFVDGRQELPRQ